MFRVRFTNGIIGLCIWVFTLSSAAANVFTPDNPAISYTGRFSEDCRFGWTGSLIETQFTGSNISAKLRLIQGYSAGLTILINGKPHFLKVTQDQLFYPLAEGLEIGKLHTIGIFKRSEGERGTVQFLGLETSNDGTLIPISTSDRRMLAIGDSITCGYGNEATSVEEGNTVENENGYMSYAAIAARELDANLMMVCWSGRGMHRNRSLQNDQVGTLPQLFDQTLPFDTGLEWNHQKFIPEVIIINLGTNDATTLNGEKPPLDQANFIQTYTTFIQRLRSIAPDSILFICIGPMNDRGVASWLPKIADEFENVYPLIFTSFDGDEDIGGHYHPSVLKHEKMAKQLVQAIRNETSW